MAEKPASGPKETTGFQYVDGLKITSRSFLQCENGWNKIGYSWYSLKKTYNISNYFTVEFSADVARKYTARGLYCQEIPYEQSLLITCTDGCTAIIVLDLRKDSCTYLMHNRLVLDASLDVRRSIYIPRGVAYGFVTLEDNTRIDFKVDNYCEHRFKKTYNMLDPQFGITVPFPDKTGTNTPLFYLLSKGELLISAQDRSAPWVIDVAGVEEINVDIQDDKTAIDDIDFSVYGENMIAENADAISNIARPNEAKPGETAVEEAVEGNA